MLFRVTHLEFEIQEDTKIWFAKYFGDIASGSPADVLREAETLADLLTRLYDSFRFHLSTAQTFFKNFEVDYLSLTFPVVIAQVIADGEPKLQ